jgi:hypothetical protein
MKLNYFFIAGIMLTLLLFILFGCDKNSNSPESNTNNDVVNIGGHVYLSNSANIPIPNATVGTSLDTVKTITDSLGSFMLTTITPAHYSTTPYTIYITASGYQSGGGTWRWGDHPINQVFYLSH